MEKLKVRLELVLLTWPLFAFNPTKGTSSSIWGRPMVDSTFLHRPNVSDRRFNTLRHPSGFYLRIDEVDLRQIEKSISKPVPRLARIIGTNWALRFKITPNGNPKAAILGTDARGSFTYCVDAGTMTYFSHLRMVELSRKKKSIGHNFCRFRLLITIFRVT